MLFNTNDDDSVKKLSRELDYLNELTKGEKVTYRIEIKKNRAIRSVSANSYYWVILTAIAAHTGETKERLHDWYNLEFNSEEFNGKTIPRSTKELDTQEMSILIKKIKTHAHDFYGVYIPEAGDQAYAMWERLAKNSYDAMFNSI
jgi:hypothetical protein